MKKTIQVDKQGLATSLENVIRLKLLGYNAANKKFLSTFFINCHQLREKKNILGLALSKDKIDKIFWDKDKFIVKLVFVKLDKFCGIFYKNNEKEKYK